VSNGTSALLGYTEPFTS